MNDNIKDYIEKYCVKRQFVQGDVVSFRPYALFSSAEKEEASKERQGVVVDSWVDPRNLMAYVEFVSKADKENPETVNFIRALASNLVPDTSYLVAYDEGKGIRTEIVSGYELLLVKSAVEESPTVN